MLTASDNRLLIEVGADAPMGRFMRQYWIPVLRASQLEPGAAPHRLTILGEKLVAFRSPGGQVGVMDEACPHRGASMALARNEDCGLRCVYHGWLIDPQGALVEAPTHPEGAPLHRMRTRSHPARESQGMIWTWLGEGEPPAFPKLSFTDLPDDHVATYTAVVNCSWLHPLETLWDVFHSQILHNQSNRASSRAKAFFSETGRRSGDLEFDYPEMQARRTDYGFAYSNTDAAKELRYHFIAPFIQHQAPSPRPEDDQALQISVPIDDDHCLLWLITYNRLRPVATGSGGLGLGVLQNPDNFIEGMDDRRPENRWGQDRAAMERGESFAGVTGMGAIVVMAEDILVIESQGRADRTRENLAPVDRALVEGRRTLIDAVKAHERGEPPLGRDLDLTHVRGEFHPLQSAAK